MWNGDNNTKTKKRDDDDRVDDDDDGDDDEADADDEERRKEDEEEGKNKKNNYNAEDWAFAWKKTNKTRAAQCSLVLSAKRIKNLCGCTIRMKTR